MPDLLRRFKRDLAANRKKTALMVVLAVILIVAWWIALSGGDGKPRPRRATPVSGTAAAVPKAGSPPAAVGRDAVVKAEGVEGKRGLHAGIPSILGDPLPFEALGRNPFRPPAASSDETPAARSRTGESAGKSAVEEARALERLELQCTVKGPGGDFAVVSGKMLAPGDLYQGFRLEEVGEGYAVLSGRYVKRRIEVRPGTAGPRRDPGSLQEKRKRGR